MSETELRALVRDLLREVLAGRGGGPTAGKPIMEPVSLATDAALAAFIKRLVALLDDPVTGNAVRSGQHCFTLQTAAPCTEDAAATAGQAPVLSGAITESKIDKCAEAGVVRIAPDAVVTPLARDRARALGLKLERKD